MRILFDIGHPAHVHFFRHPIAALHGAGHQLMVTSRRKEMAAELLDELAIEHRVLSGLGRHGLASLAAELLQRNVALARVVRAFRPQVLAGVGGTFIAHVGAVLRVPSLVFYDTENATAQNAITYPLAGCVLVPRCYQGWLPRRHLRYAGYHELAYLHPRYFRPDRARALAAGLAEQGDTFLLRLVSWQASHDVAERGWTAAVLQRVVERLQAAGRVLISAEAALPAALEPLRYRGPVGDIHHLMAGCRAVIGESATMASEAAVLGVPAIYAARTGRGYTDEQEQRYALVTNLRQVHADAIIAAVEQVLATPACVYAQRRQRLLDECVDVSAYVVRCIEAAGGGIAALLDTEGA